VRDPEAAAALRRCLAGGGSPPATALERAAAAGALAELRDTTARPALVGLLGEQDAGLVASAVEALGDLGGDDPATVTAIVAAMRANASPNEPDVLVSGLQALGKLKASAGVPLAEEALGSAQPAVREAARGLLRAVLGDSAAAAAAAAHGPPPWRAAPVADYRQALPSAQTAVIRTARGEITLELYPEDAPRTVANFVTLARRGYYDKLAFHRVVPNFVVQGGDPRGDGYGGPGYSLRCEINAHPFRRGTVGMALAGKDTGGSQFFITHSAQPQLDGRHTVIGQLEGGLEVLDALQAGDRMLKVRIEIRDRREDGARPPGRPLAAPGAPR
jgi:cyclophilin family peptidyl-prolyl cis-trans isomerase